MTEPFARAAAPLCIVTLTYVADLAAIDAAMTDHVAWLSEGYRNDLILVSGRRTPRTGGVIVMRGDHDAVAALVATDPFVAGKLATAEITAFTGSMVATALADMLG